MAIVIAVAGAFALRETPIGCTADEQYHFDGARFRRAGILGVDFQCSASADTCTYILEAGYYRPCHAGTYGLAP
jgi:hypothetical protein